MFLTRCFEASDSCNIQIIGDDVVRPLADEGNIRRYDLIFCDREMLRELSPLDVGPWKDAGKRLQSRAFPGRGSEFGGYCEENAAIEFVIVTY